MVLKRFHSYCVWQSTNLFLFPIILQSLENKKVPKDCHAYTWYPLTLLTILNSVCPGLPKNGRNLALGTRFTDISGMFCLSLFPVYRYRIKINYGIILAQHLVFCQLNNAISSVFVFNFLFLARKNFFTFFKFFQVSVQMLDISFIDCPVTASCIRHPFFDN